MKKILVLSIQHTGTFFVSKTLAAAYPESHLRIGSLYAKHREMKHKRYINEGAIELSDFYPPKEEVPKNYIDKTVLSVCPKGSLDNKDIVIGHEHFHKPDSWILNALKQNPAKCPIVIPVRDPILSLHSKIWREIEQHNNPKGKKEKSRKHRLNKWVKLYKDILSIPKNNVFHLPIDAFHTETEETRVQLIKDMYDYCDLPFNKSAQTAAEEWKPTNTTYNLIKKEILKTPSPKWENFKVKYLERNIEHTKAIMDIEFEQLHKEHELIDLMKKIGYKDVLWW